jgi:zinc protease
MIGIKAGSKHDPSDATGLAHYLEHMMFKGTRNFGTQDWEKEKQLLVKIEQLYEKHRNEKDVTKKKEIYAEIDKISNEASGIAIPNEYDKMISSLGAKGTNAYTSVEQTVYINDIPNNELEKWLKIESERFREVVLRLFHTELEAVYEEFNIGQANDDRKVYKAIMELLFPNHTYGTQTTIGTGEHLKNPSMTRIYEYFKTYYVPNNMVIVMSGDFNPDEVYNLIKKYFGDYVAKPVPTFKVNEQPIISNKIAHEVFGKEKAVCEMGYRFKGVGTRENLLANTCALLLNNGKAGLIDLNVIQKQTMLEAGATVWNMKDFSVFNIFGTPREGQSVEEVEKILQNEIEKLKSGEFEEWLIQACAKDGKLSQMSAFEKKSSTSKYFNKSIYTRC